MVPVVFNPIVGTWVAYRGYKEALVYGSLLSISGFLAMAFVQSRSVLAIGYGLSLFLLSLRRTVRCHHPNNQVFTVLLGISFLHCVNNSPGGGAIDSDKPLTVSNILSLAHAGNVLGCSGRKPWGCPWCCTRTPLQTD